METATRLYRLSLTAATATTAVAAVIGLIWLIWPDTSFYYTTADNAMLADVLGPTAATTIHTLAASVGVAAGIAALAGALGRHGVLTVGILQTLVFGVGFGSMDTLSTSGYLVSMAMPAVVVLLLVQVIRTYPVARWTVGVPMLVLAATALVLGRDAVIAHLGALLPALARQSGELLITLLLIAIGAAWATAAAASVRDTDLATRATAWVTRHRRLFTVIAACGPLPYALARLSWLTPWPLLGGDAAADLPVRLQGLALSSGAWLGIVLTIGLIRPWGEVFPRWIPIVAGRSVPIAAAALPGGVVAAILSFAAVPMLYTAATMGPEALLAIAIAFPCWFWGPSLALAVWGYVGHRQRDRHAELPPAIPAAGH